MAMAMQTQPSVAKGRKHMSTGARYGLMSSMRDCVNPVGVILTAFLLAILVLLPRCAASADEAAVVRVIDGDTIVIGGEYRVRYIGIDTPEIGEPYYDEAKQCNRELVDNQLVRLEKDVTGKDRYGRLLRYVFVDGVFVNAELVRRGYATVYPRDLFPDNRHHDTLIEAEGEAKKAERGIWAAP